MDYFIVSKAHEGLMEVISKIFENSKDVKVVSDRRINKNEQYSGIDRRNINKVAKIA